MGNHRYCLRVNIVDVNNKFTIQLLDLCKKYSMLKYLRMNMNLKVKRGRPKSENKVKLKHQKRGRPKKVLIDSKESVEKQFWTIWTV